MTETKPPWRLEIYGQDYTDDCDDLKVGTPSLVYADWYDGSGAQRRHLGPKGFEITLIGPSQRLCALADGGDQIRVVKVTCAGQSIQAPVLFHEEWVGRDGVRKMFGSLYVDPDREPTWVAEPDNDGGQRPLTPAAKEG
jgi:hypothetical protein